MKVRANGIEMNYELTGEGDCLVLIHGAVDNLRMWYGQVPVFSRGYRVLTYDVRGHGETECPDGPLSLDVLAVDLQELLRVLGIQRAFVLGYSMGGRIGLQLALNKPSMVRALVMANSGIGLGTPSPEAVERRQRLVTTLERGDLDTVSEEMTALSFSPGLKGRNPELFERYRRIKLANAPRSVARVWGSMARAARADVDRLSCPVLIIAGEQDAFAPLEVARLTHEAILGSRLEVLPTGHAAALEAPEEFNRIVLDFLTNVKRNEGG